MYNETFRESWKRLKFELFVPDIVLILISLVLGLILFRISGVSEFSGGNIEEIISSLLLQSSVLFKIIVSFAIFLIFTFFVGSGVLGWKYGMIKNLVNGKKIDLVKQFNEGRTYIWSIVLLRLLMYSLYVVLLLVVALLFFLFAYPVQDLGGVIGFSVLGFVLAIALSLGMFFRYPILFYDVKNPVDVIKKSFSLARNSFGVIIFSVLILAGVNIGFGIILNLLNLLFGDNVIYVIISVLIGLIPSIWGDLFLFGIYKKIK